MKLQRLGNYERYVVLNDDGRYWAGVCWTSSLREARVFAELTTSSWIPLEELRETLQRYVSIFNELQDDVLILDVEVDWDTLREREDD